MRCYANSAEAHSQVAVLNFLDTILLVHRNAFNGKAVLSLAIPD